MPICGIMPEIDEYISIKRNQYVLMLPEREWMFGQRQCERNNQSRMFERFTGRQPN
jgi:hypothetical protein